MSYVNRPIEETVNEPMPSTRTIDYHDRVRWGPIISGLVIALATQLILSAFGAAIGANSIATSGAPRTDAGGVSNNVGIWAIASLFISLFVAGWVTARSCGPMSRSTAILNGAILWATTLAIGSWLLASGVTGAFGVVASNAGAIANQVQQGTVNVPNQTPSITAQQARDLASNTAKAGWGFVFGSLLGLLSSVVGASIGTRKPRTYS